MALIRTLFWALLFVFFTFCFVVLFEHGTHDFVPGFHEEFAKVQNFVKQATSAKPPEKKKQ